MLKQKRREAQLSTSFKKYLQHYNKYGNSAIEIKYCKGNRLNYKQNITSRIHQFAALDLAKNRRLVYKISDMDRMQKPFDMFVLENACAYYAINYNYPDDKTIYLIDVNRLSDEILLGNKKSLSIERAKEIAFDKIQIK